MIIPVFHNAIEQLGNAGDHHSHKEKWIVSVTDMTMCESVKRVRNLFLLQCFLVAMH